MTNYLTGWNRIEGSASALTLALTPTKETKKGKEKEKRIKGRGGFTRYEEQIRSYTSRID